MADERMERRFASGIELRRDGDKLILTGTAIRYGDVAKLPGGYSERIEPGAFGTVGDCILNMQHDRGRPLARTDGGGLTLSDAPEALSLRAELVATREAEDACRLVDAKVMRGFSVEMFVKREEWTGALRIVKEARLGGIALVDAPAYRLSQVALQRWANAANPAGHWWLP